MDRDTLRENVLSELGRVLMDKGAGCSVGQVVAELEGDGIDDDPYDVRDRHLLQDLEQVDEWRDDPRDLQEVEALLDLLAERWDLKPDLRLCQIVCNAHLAENGMDDFEPDYNVSMYDEPLDALTDDQLRAYLERRIAAERDHE